MLGGVEAETTDAEVAEIVDVGAGVDVERGIDVGLVEVPGRAEDVSERVWTTEDVGADVDGGTTLVEVLGRAEDGVWTTETDDDDEGTDVTLVEILGRAEGVSGSVRRTEDAGADVDGGTDATLVEVLGRAEEVSGGGVWVTGDVKVDGGTDVTLVIVLRADVEAITEEVVASNDVEAEVISREVEDGGDDSEDDEGADVGSLVVGTGLEPAEDIRI